MCFCFVVCCPHGLFVLLIMSPMMPCLFFSKLLCYLHPLCLLCAAVGRKCACPGHGGGGHVSGGGGRS